MPFLTPYTPLPTPPPEALFILGDLFNAWLGDHITTPFSEHIAQALKQLSLHCPIFFQRGNRDFLLSAHYCEKAGMTLIPEIYTFDADGLTIRLEHGDLLCTDDINYQKMRRILQHRHFRRFAAHLPPYLAKKIANTLRRQSKKRSANKPSNITDVNAQAVANASRNIDILLHGHTHRPTIHTLATGKQRIVLGDWRPEGEIAILEQGKIQLCCSKDFRTQIIS